MNLPAVSDRYDRSVETARNREIERCDRDNRKRNTDVEVALGQRLILSSPNGNRWSITVSNTGVIAAVAL